MRENDNEIQLNNLGNGDIEANGEKLEGELLVEDASEKKRSSLDRAKECIGLGLAFLLGFLKNHFSKLLLVLILGNGGVKVYLHGKDVFSVSEYAIYLQALLVCSIGVQRASFLASNLTVPNILITYTSNYIDVISVNYTGGSLASNS